MMYWLIEYIKTEGNCDASRAEEIAYDIVDIVDEMIHDRLNEEDDDDDN